jgi:outer membrane receptor protein involved in Fe transport
MSPCLLSQTDAAGGTEDIYELEVFEVTAQKREQDVQEVPISMAVLGDAFLESANILGFDQLSAFVPGLEIQIQSPNNPGFVIRGITSDSGDARVEPRVSVFQDGVSISKSRGSVVELFDMERIEVLRGPQGTLFGRGAQIGAVHLIQNKPQFIDSASFTAGYGNYSEYLLNGYVNLALNDTVAIRFAALYNERDGFIDRVDGGTLNGKETTAARLSLRYQPTQRTRLDVVLNYQYDNPPGTSFKSGTFPPRGGDLRPTAVADVGTERELFLERNVWGATVQLEHAFSERWVLTSITAYREFDSYESFDADGTAAPALWFAEDALGEQLSQEVRLNFDSGERLQGFFGVSYFREDGSQRVPFATDERSLYPLMNPLIRGAFAQAGVPDALLPPPVLMVNADGTPNSISNLPAIFAAYAALPAPLNALAPLANAPLKPNHEEASRNFGKTTAYEAFVDATYALTDRLQLTAGLRFTYEDVEAGYEVINSAVPGLLGFVTNATPNNLFVPTNGRIDATDSFTSVVGRLVASYAIQPDLNAYASVARGRRPSVINVTEAGAEVLSDEIVWSYEAGLKFLGLQRRLQVDFSVFYYEYSNFQTSVTEITEQGIFRVVTRDAGNATAYGFEQSLRYLAADGLTLFANYGYIHGTFDDVDDAGRPQELAGNTFRLTPEHSLAVGLDYRFMLGNGGSLTFSPNYTWKSRVYFEEENQPGVEQGAYGLLNATIRYQTSQQRWEFALYGRNLLDKLHVIDGGNTGATFGIPTFIGGPRRSYGVKVTYHW